MHDAHVHAWIIYNDRIAAYWRRMDEDRYRRLRSGVPLSQLDD